MTEASTDIDTPKLELYLTEALGIDITQTGVLSNKVNLVIVISTEEEENAYVLRRPNALRHTSLFNDLKQEYRLLQRLQRTTLPTQTPILFCDDRSVLGDPFLVTTYLNGATIPLGSDLPERFQNTKSRSNVADLLIDTLAEIHGLDVESYEDVCEHQTPHEQVTRTTELLDAATSVTGRDLPKLRSVAEWLQQNTPSNSETTLVHGDFRPGNLLFAGTAQPEITGVLDWETAMLGDPLIELGYLLLRWRDDDDPTPSLNELEARYPDADAIQQLREVNENGLAPFSANPGSPSRRELVARYEDQAGIAFENEQFYRAYAAFSLATVWENFHRHQLEAGETSSWGPHVDYMAMIADSIVTGEFQL